MPASHEDFRRQDFIEAGLRLRRYELEMQWDAMYGRSAGSSPAPPIAEPEEAQLVTRKQACNLLAVSAATLDRLRKAGQLSPISRLLPMIRFRLEDLERLQRKRK